MTTAAPRARYYLLKHHGLSREKLRAAVRSDPKVRAEAEQELALAAQIDRDRDIVSAEYADMLREVLG